MRALKRVVGLSNQGWSGSESALTSHFRDFPYLGIASPASMLSENGSLQVHLETAQVSGKSASCARVAKLYCARLSLVVPAQALLGPRKLHLVCTSFASACQELLILVQGLASFTKFAVVLSLLLLLLLLK